MKIKYFVISVTHCWFFTHESKISLAEKITFKPNAHFTLGEYRTCSQGEFSATSH